MMSTILLLTADSLHSQQRYYDTWVFGQAYGLNFQTLVQPGRSAVDAYEGCASICDPSTGDLLFYTNGATVFNRNNAIMSNGTGLFGNQSCTQSSVIVPHPGDPTLFYVFTLDGVTSGGPVAPQDRGMRYSIVDMTGDNGLGAVVEKNTTLLLSATEKVVAVRHARGCGYWVVTHERRNNRFYAWLVTINGLDPQPVISEAGSSYDNTMEAGYLKASPDGTMLFAARSRLAFNRNVGELFRFDNVNGNVTQYLTSIPSAYGATFSPNNDYLYTSVGDSLLQFDLTVPPAQIVSTRTTLNEPEFGRIFYGMQIAPNGKVYLVNGPYITSGFDISDMRIDVINRPNFPGSVAQYDFAFNYNRTRLFAGLPNCIDGFLGDGDYRTEPGNGAQATVEAIDTIICEGDETLLKVKGGRDVTWLDDVQVDCRNCPETTIRPSETTTYLAEVRFENPCWLPDTVAITVHVIPTPEAYAGRDTAICTGKSIQLQGSGEGKIRWAPAEELSCVDCLDPIATPSRTTTYYLFVEGDAGCRDVDSVKVVVDDYSPLKIDMPDTTIFCGGSVQFSVPGALQYDWSPAASLSCVNCPDPIATPTETTAYYLVLVDSAGCPGLDSIVVNVEEGRVSAGRDTSICFGGEVQLSATGRRDYTWRPASGLSCTDCPNPIASPRVTTTYVVEGTVDGKCLSFDTITVRVSDSIEAGPDRIICIGDTVHLEIEAGSGDVSWKNLRNINLDDPLRPYAWPTETITYYVRVEFDGGCFLWDSVTVTVVDRPEVTARPDTAICIGDPIQLSAEGMERYTWSSVDNSLSCTECREPVVMPTETTTYYVVGSNASGSCMAVDSVTVSVRSRPNAEAGEGGRVCAGGEIDLSASGGTTYRWDPTIDLSCLDCPNPTATPKGPETYYVTVFDEFGCSSRDSVSVGVYPEHTVSAGDDQAICLGNSAQLNAAGGVRWSWEGDGWMSCTDCPDPMVRPTSDTEYRLTSWNADGCVAYDTVLVAVRTEPEIVKLKIRREFRERFDRILTIPVEIIGGPNPTDISDLEVRIVFDQRVMQIDRESIRRLLSGTALEGWDIEVGGDVGELILQAKAPAGTVLSALPGELFRFESNLFVASTPGTELVMDVSSSSNCLSFESLPGYARVDSICGLNMRLIEAGTSKYVAPDAYPNPASDRVTFEFGLGLDGPTRMEVFDARGNLLGVVLDGTYDAGRYSVEWNVRDLASGVYIYRLVSGDWVRTGQVRVKQ